MSNFVVLVSGRLNRPGQCNLRRFDRTFDAQQSQRHAVLAFENKFYQKTGNEWGKEAGSVRTQQSTAPLYPTQLGLDLSDEPV